MFNGLNGFMYQNKMVKKSALLYSGFLYEVINKEVERQLLCDVMVETVYL